MHCTHRPMRTVHAHTAKSAGVICLRPRERRFFNLSIMLMVTFYIKGEKKSFLRWLHFKHFFDTCIKLNWYLICLFKYLFLAEVEKIVIMIRKVYSCHSPFRRIEDNSDSGKENPHRHTQIIIDHEQIDRCSLEVCFT